MIRYGQKVFNNNAGGKQLIIEFVPDCDIANAIEKNISPYALSLDKERDKSNLLKNSKEKVEEVVVEEPIKTLDNLFKKTSTKPHIYYLPLSEDEVNSFRI